jgi:hypothetical protein
MIDAHESGYKGQLTAGISEAGFVKYNQVNSYLYSFSVYETQKINFEVNLNTITGDADLYIKKCKNMSDCNTTLKDLQDLKEETDQYFLVRNTQNLK